jgi:hypothetical protein
MSKIIERIVYNQLESYLIKNSLLYQHQSGFRSAFSTETTLIHLTDSIKRQADMGHYTGMIVLDLQKAFDTVNHPILLNKLKALGLAKKSVEWFQSYLTDRFQVVDIDGTISSKSNITCGVPQGSILGPLLFLIYVNDMESSVGCDLLLYADDSALMVSNKDPKYIEKSLSAELSSISEWLADNKLSLHLGKTESILFGSKHKLKKCNQLKICCNGIDICPSPQIKYLGCDLEQTLTGNLLGNNIIKKTNSKLKFLFRKTKNLNIATKKLLASALVQCHLDYCCCSWYFGLSKTLKNKLQIIQNKMIRFTLGLQHRHHISIDNFLDLQWFPIKYRVSQISLTHMFKIVHNRAPSYLCNSFTKVESCHNHNTRSGSLAIYIPSINSFGQKSFFYSASKLWNSLPYIIQSAHSLNTFKYKLKSFLSDQFLKDHNSDFLYD